MEGNRFRDQVLRARSRERHLLNRRVPAINRTIRTLDQDQNRPAGVALGSVPNS
jgi:hypothetical protein